LDNANHNNIYKLKLQTIKSGTVENKKGSGEFAWVLLLLFVFIRFIWNSVSIMEFLSNPNYEVSWTTYPFLEYFIFWIWLTLLYLIALIGLIEKYNWAFFLIIGIALIDMGIALMDIETATSPADVSTASHALISDLLLIIVAFYAYNQLKQK
jgi:hypothetical protein